VQGELPDVLGRGGQQRLDPDGVETTAAGSAEHASLLPIAEDRLDRAGFPTVCRAGRLRGAGRRSELGRLVGAVRVRVPEVGHVLADRGQLSDQLAAAHPAQVGMRGDPRGDREVTSASDKPGPPSMPHDVGE
jgi:hypothetical protein